MDPAIMAANEKRNLVLTDEETQRLYLNRELARMDEISGRNYAREEGRLEGERKILDLLGSGKSPEEIIRDYSE